jgi:hypothetical protein
MAAAPPDQSAIARLIAETVLPAPMPGLHMRLIAPTDGAANARPYNTRVDRDPAPDEESSQLQRGFVIPKAPKADEDTRDQRGETRAAPAQFASRAPEININEVADKVLQTLARRQRLEKERRGLY